MTTSLRKQPKPPINYGVKNMSASQEIQKTVNIFSRRKRTADKIQEEMISDPIYGEAFAEIFKTHKIVYRDPLGPKGPPGPKDPRLRRSTPNNF